MSENEIKENNKLIARFMGWTVEKSCFSKVEKYGDKMQNERGISVKNRDYHSDWNLLMPVVEKIRKSAGACIDSDSDEKKFAFLLFSLGIITPIETVYMYVINYIEWYNTQSFS